MRDYFLLQSTTLPLGATVSYTQHKGSTQYDFGFLPVIFYLACNHQGKLPLISIAVVCYLECVGFFFMTQINRLHMEKKNTITLPLKVMCKQFRANWVSPQQMSYFKLNANGPPLCSTLSLKQCHNAQNNIAVLFIRFCIHLKVRDPDSVVEISFIFP